MNTSLSAVLLHFVILGSANACRNIEVVTRAEWGASPPRSKESLKIPVGQVFIHHTDESQCHNKSSCIKTVQGIQRYHMDVRGWDDIGYNFLIGGDGRIYEGRGWRVVGAHTLGFNFVSIGISLMGNYTKLVPSDLMLSSTLNLIACGKQLNYFSGDMRLHGHRDGDCTSCPGNALYSIIKKWPDFRGGPLPGYLCPGCNKPSKVNSCKKANEL